MTGPVIPTVTLTPEIIQEGVPVQPKTALIEVLNRMQLGKNGGDAMPAAVSQQIYNAIMASPNLIAELNAASNASLLANIQYSATGDAFSYNPKTHSIVISQGYLDGLSTYQANPAAALTEQLGHEAYHAMDAANAGEVRQQTLLVKYLDEEMKAR